MTLETVPLTIANRTFESRLFLGTGKFSSNKAMSNALETSGTQIVTVALRRADLSGNNDPYADILEHIDPERYLILPNTSGAMMPKKLFVWLNSLPQLDYLNGSSWRFILIHVIYCLILLKHIMLLKPS